MNRVSIAATVTCVALLKPYGLVLTANFPGGLMLFTIVSERRGVTSKSTSTSPQEALARASILVQDGVEKVWVFDANGAFVSASALSQLARRCADFTRPPAVAVSGTADLLAGDHGTGGAALKDGGTAAVETSTGKISLAQGNARVFRIAKHRY